MTRRCDMHDLGRVPWREAFSIQQQLVAKRKADLISDQFLIVEHPHVITMGRNGHSENILADANILERAGIDFHETDRGGDVTYHGPGQIVGYPIIDLRNWNRDVHAYVRAIEDMLIATLADFGIRACSVPRLTGVWVGDAKIAAIGVHITRWITSHGFAFNLAPDLGFFQYIVPCGLTKPVISMAALGVEASRAQVIARIAFHFARVFDFDLHESTLTEIEREPAHSLAF